MRGLILGSAPTPPWIGCGMWKEEGLRGLGNGLMDPESQWRSARCWIDHLRRNCFLEQIQWH
jgi:hypothetical protein